MFKSSIAFVSCSNGLSRACKNQVESLVSFCEAHGFRVLQSPYLYAPGNAPAYSAQQRGLALMSYFNNRSVSYIFDLSGGDMANEVIPFLDFDQIKASAATFCGYSDLTTLINAFACKSAKSSVLYQPRHITQNPPLQPCFFGQLSSKSGSLFDFSYRFLQGNSLSGRVIGGNIRCFLKLAGTPFFPSCKDTVLFLEAYSGTHPKLCTYFAQLSQMGVFRQVGGILLGTFTEFEQTPSNESVFPLLAPYLPPNLPVAQTQQIGHEVSSLALMIGGTLNLAAKESEPIVKGLSVIP